MARKKKISESEIDEVMGEVIEGLENSSAEELGSVVKKSRSKKQGQVKSSYQDHAKFAKFKVKQGDN